MWNVMLGTQYTCILEVHVASQNLKNALRALRGARVHLCDCDGLQPNSKRNLLAMASTLEAMASRTCSPWSLLSARVSNKFTCASSQFGATCNLNGICGPGGHRTSVDGLDHESEQRRRSDAWSKNMLTCDVR